MTLRSGMLRGVAWTATGQAGSYVMRFVVSVVLARLLTPRDFGLIGMIVVFSGFSNLFATLGLPSALIQRRELEPGHRVTAFWTTITSSVAVWAILAASGPLLARLYEEPRLPALVVVVSASIPLASFGSVHTALLSRELRFDALARIDLAALLVGAILAVILALGGAGAWSLVAQSVVSAFVGSALAWRSHGWRPWVGFSRRHFRELFAFGGSATGYSVMNYWARQADDLLVGARLGASPLGLYSRAYSTLLFPVVNVGQVLGRVMFPAFSRMQDDPELLRRNYLRAVRMIGLVLFPVMAGLYAVAHDVVLVVYGEKWLGMVPLVEVFALLGLSQSIATTVGWIFQALGRTKQMLHWGIFAAPVLIASFFVGLRWGAVGVAAAYTVTSLALTPLSIRIAGAPIGVGPFLVGRNIGGAALAAGVMTVVVRVFVAGSVWNLPPVGQLAVAVALGCAVYLGLVWLVARATMREALTLIREFRE